MRIVLGIIASLLISGCTSTYDAKISRCGAMGMVQEGFTITSIQHGNSYGHINCKKPETDEEICAMEKEQMIFLMKRQFDAHWRFKFGQQDQAWAAKKEMNQKIREIEDHECDAEEDDQETAH